MRCHAVRRRLSAFLDGDLAPADARAVGAHVDACPACGERARALRVVSEALGEMTRLEAPPAMAQAVRDRLEMERRDPGLAFLFRSSWRARPLMLPSLIPAALVLVTVLAAALALDQDPFRVRLEPDASASWERRYPPSGTEANPLLPVAGVRAPRARPSGALPAEALAGMEEGTLFLETVVARDGSVSAVNLLQGNSHQAGPVLEALRRERFWPGQYNGRPVAVSVYRLISRMDVRPPIT
jgi:hypothetical protein